MRLLLFCSIIILIIAVILYRYRWYIKAFFSYDTMQEAEFERIRLKILACNNESQLTLCVAVDIKIFQQKYDNLEAIHQRDELFKLVETMDKELIVDHNLKLQNPLIQTA